MEELSILLKTDSTVLLSTIDKYQSDIINEFLLQTSNNYLESADRWLNASISNTATFGGEGKKTTIYREKLLEEIEKFICGDKQYEEDRKKIEESTDKTQQYIIGVMSIAIGKSLGVAGTFIAPVLVLLILSIGKMAVNAWCQMRREIKTTIEDK